ncbi:LysR family transcriptional regulator [Gordonia sp. CPCC 206044]|uniref:LysR family transcriptional regulator n=1 Tax=Gordonia sp. CPCC 206044 TaxID=3140793 RepID=UPI003AF33D3C
MELRQIRAFLAVAEELHFGRAAARLHIAQSPLSQMIRSLEKELDAELFVRTTRSVQLSAAGTALLGPARIIDTQVQAARAVTRAAATGETGVVRIGFGGASGYVALSALTRAMAERHPGIHLDLRPQTYTGEVIELLDDGTIDMGIVALPVAAELSTVTMRIEPLVVAMPAAHPLAAHTSVSVGDLIDEPFVVYPSAHGSKVRDAAFALCSGAGFVPRIAREAPDPYSLLALVGVGIGVAVVVAATTHISVDGVVYRPIDGDVPELRIALAWRTDRMSPVVDRVVEMIRETHR